ncbi:hypothetical protein Cni_G20160 [Canna indica]|uniref:RIN4 pathogenic type III effector avirulence factor Avr cleavage site domain-containing protein n=1 Tax=Canna indica TaxID=4628 RepID=A0AAQ3QJ88_9LILI|nr:hypothetical protein Cni_G20160 [Canna indica]
MATNQEQVPKFGNWGTAESVPYTEYFDQARRKRNGKTTANPNDHKETSKDFVKDTPSQLNAAPLTTGSNPETRKPKDSKPRKDSGSYHRTDAPSVHKEGVIRKSPANPHHQRYVDQANHSDNQKRASKTYGSSYEGKPADRTGNNPASERKLASEGTTPGRTKTNPGDRVYRTQPVHDDVPVPPFAEWDENDPASGEKYTGIFKTIADSRRTPGTPYQPPEPSNQQQNSTGDKGCGCLNWFLK